MRTILSLQLLFLLLMFSTANAFAQFGTNQRQVSFYYGQTYRINDKFYNTFDISFEHLRTSCTHASFKGAGVRFDYFGKNSFAIGVRYFKAFVRRPDTFAPYFGISPIFFQFNSLMGMNLKPEIGIKFNPFFYSAIDVVLNASYGYDIPVINETNFKAGRHDLSVRIGFSIDLFKLIKLEKDSDSNTDNGKDTGEDKLIK